MKKLLIILGLLISFWVSAQSDTIVSGIDTTLITTNGFNISTFNTPLSIKIENSSFITTSGGYILKMGYDSYDAGTANAVDESVFTGNFIKDNTWAAGTHFILAGYSIDYKIKFNRFETGDLGIVGEGGYDEGVPMVNGDYEVRGNIFKNIDNPCSIMGYQNVTIVNNTFYNNVSHDPQIRIVPSNGTTIPAYSKSVTVKNNIFYSKVGEYAFNVGATCDTGLVVDYNVYFFDGRTDNEPNFHYKGTDYSWDEWRAEGYDAHSVIVNPNFTDTIDFIPTTALEYGETLGDEYSYALDTGYVFSLGSHPDTVLQEGTWQVGAVIYETLQDYNVYFVQDTSVNVNANDTNAGTNISLPWATWQHAFETAEAGDTVYFRGGTWYPDTKAKVGYGICVIDPGSGYGNDGTYANPIVYMNYQNEIPVFDGQVASQSTTGNIGIAITEATYLKFKGLTIRNVLMIHPTANTTGTEVVDCGNIWFENMIVHDIGGAGMSHGGYDTLYVKNCDVYNCCDSLENGGDGDGFLCASGGTAIDTFKIAYFEGCRSWDNSDDGYDFGTTKQLHILNCWAFSNGYLEGDGNGFKHSYSNVLDMSKRTMINCITSNNNNHHGIGTSTANLVDSIYGPFMSYYNNFSYMDQQGFNHVGLDSNWDEVNGRAGVIMRNNIIYGSTSAYFLTWDNRLDRFCVEDHNSHIYWEDEDYYPDRAPWPYGEVNPAYTITDADFGSLDTLELRRDRQIDGSLPEIDFGKLVASSDLIDGGIDVGLPYNGSAPDLGYVEYATLAAGSDSIIITSDAMLTDSIANNRVAGDVLFLKGTFSQSHDFDFNGTQTYPITVKAHPTTNATFTAYQTISGNHILFQNLRFNYDTYLSGDSITFQSDTIANEGLHLSGVLPSITSCTFSQCDTAVYFNEAETPIFTNNTITSTTEVVLQIEFPPNDYRGYYYDLDNNIYNLAPGTLFKGTGWTDNWGGYRARFPKYDNSSTFNITE